MDLGSSPGQTARSVFNYVAYGLRIRSFLELPELATDDGDPDTLDVIVRLGPVGREVDDVDDNGRAFWASANEACYFYKKSGKYLVREGREIVVEPVQGAPKMLVRLSLIGPVLGLILIQRGFLLLHASAIAIEERGVAFLGGHAWGKSTLAASLHALGHRLLSDDLTAIQLRHSGEAMIIPSFPHLRLWPDVVTSLGESAERLPKLHPELDKRRLRVKDRFDVAPVPLELLCVLGQGPQLSLQRMEPELAVAALLTHWYGARFGPGILACVDLSAHFLRCAQVAQSVSVARLRRPASENPADLDFARAIEADVRRYLGG